MEEEGSVELDVGLQPPAGFVLFEQPYGGLFDFAGEVVELHVAVACVEALGGCGQNAGRGAPPCSGPLRAPTAPTIAETRSDPVDVITRAVNVEALRP